jgi:hypothetical protein
VGGRTSGWRWWLPRLLVPARGSSVGEVDTSASFSSWDRGGKRLSCHGRWVGTGPRRGGSAGGHGGVQERGRDSAQDAKG